MQLPCVVLYGLDGLCDIMTFADDKEDFFKEEFGIEKMQSKLKQRYSVL